MSVVLVGGGGGARVGPPFGQMGEDVIPPLIAPPTNPTQGVPPQVRIGPFGLFCSELRLLVLKNEILD